MSANSAKFFQNVVWSHFLFLTLTPVFTIVGSVYLFPFSAVHWATWLLTFVMFYLTGISIGAGYHRLFSHRAYEASWPVRLILLVFGAASFQGSIKHWCAQHRKHHRYVDTERDPYNIKRGFLYAHMGWVVMKPDFPVTYENIPDLEKDPLVRFQHRFYMPLAIFFGIFFPGIVAALWGNFWAGLIIAGLFRIVVNHHFTFFINSYCHYFGKQTFSDRTTARDSGFIAFFTYGEGYHNFHHSFEVDYRNGYRFWHWDPNKWVIYVLHKIKLAWNLKRVSDYKILAQKLVMQKQKLCERIQSEPCPLSVRERISIVIENSYKKVDLAHQHLFKLKQHYQELKEAKIDALGKNLEHVKSELQLAKMEFNHSLQTWLFLLRHPAQAHLVPC